MKLLKIFKIPKYKLKEWIKIKYNSYSIRGNILWLGIQINN